MVAQAAPKGTAGQNSAYSRAGPHRGPPELRGPAAFLVSAITLYRF